MVSRQPQFKPDKSFFPQAVPARQPMADIYVRLRDLAVPRMGRQKLAPPGTNRLHCEQTAKTVYQLGKSGRPLFARVLRHHPKSVHAVSTEGHESPNLLD